MLIEQETDTVPEAVGIFHSPEELQGAIDELLSSGFDRGAESARQRGRRRGKARALKVRHLADDPEVPQDAYVSTEAIGGAEGALIGGLMYVGAAVGPAPSWPPEAP